jgi:hypothetical protein
MQRKPTAISDKTPFEWGIESRNMLTENGEDYLRACEECMADALMFKHGSIEREEFSRGFNINASGG